MKHVFIALFIGLFSLPAMAQDANLDRLLTDRVLGDPNAPVTIVEHSSLTCPHCMAFHTQTLPKIKESLIDTGKAKLLFSDYPLNAPALQGSMIARCFEDDDLYFDYIDFLFQTQSNWAGVPDPRPYLAQNARLLGISSDQLDSCMQTEGYQDAFIKKVQETSEFKQVKSTPTFIIAETGERLIGNKPYPVFETAVNFALKQAKEDKSESEDADKAEKEE